MILFAMKNITNGTKATILGVNLLFSRRLYKTRWGLAKDDATYQIHMGLRSIYIGRKNTGTWGHMFKRWAKG